jgi:hypothetical protein
LLGAFAGAVVPSACGVDFVRDVRPIFEKHCVECHGAVKQKSGYRLDVREAAILAHDAKGSRLVRYVSGEDEEMLMPPRKSNKPRLSAAEVETLRVWISEGPVWPDGAAGATEVFSIGSRKERLPWIWQTPQRQTPPDVAVATDVDRFLLAKLREKGIAPAPPTDDLTWLRRAHFAITGLPPSRGEMQAFLADRTEERRARVVDGLLASPHFGERWARHWMDLVRYAESRGHEDDFSIANAWQYRDYLIRAMNADVRYDRFVAEHIAGDLLPPRLGAGEVNESVLATGWAFLGEEIHNPVDIRQDECERVDNKVDVLSKTFLGLTVACARCHDHKFDAISQRDYYALSGFILSSPLRQVRFETMVPHAAVAKRLEALRAAHLAGTASEYAESATAEVSKMAAHLLAARRVLFGEKAETVSAATGLQAVRLGEWLEELKRAVSDPASPLHFFTMLAHEPEAENEARFPTLLAKRALPSVALPKDAVVIADYTVPGGAPVKIDGPALRYVNAGELIPGTPQQPLARVMPYGAVVRDAFWNRLALAPGTEMDSGILAAAGRAGKTLLSPKVELKSGKLHYLLRGKAHVYAGVDTHTMLVGGLHGALSVDFDTKGALRWESHNLASYAGHRTHLEFSPRGDSPLEVLMIVDSPERPSLLPQAQWRPAGDVASLRAVAEQLQGDFAAAQKALAAAKVGPREAVMADWIAQHGALLGATAKADAFFREEEALAKSVRWESATAVGWADGTGVDEHILIRGKPARPGAVAPRGLPEAFGQARTAPSAASGRAELAAQMTSPENPLVARVAVNRIWHHIFGRGIVPTVDNFGYLGERPTHPELLDDLAWKFVHEDGWSVKAMIRRLVLTDAFARSSRVADPRAVELDPSNVLLHRYPVRRLEGESIRDALLAISGQLDPKLYGRPIPVHLTDFIVGRGRPSESGPLNGAGRRSIYISARRNFLPTMMLAFDLPTPFSTVGRRNVTNVPAQSLVMMNDPFVREQAAAFAARMLREVPSASAVERIGWLFETAMCRPPTPEELALCKESLAELKTLHPGAEERAIWSEFCHGLLSANDFIYLK